MYSLTSLAFVAAAITSSVFGQTPPGFSPSSSSRLDLAFGNINITPGLQIGISVPASVPKVAAETTLSGTYLLTIVDPDAPTPQNPNVSQILHLLQPSVTFASAAPRVATFNAPAIVPYARPQPPPSSAAHRYIAVLFSQPANFTVPAAFRAFNATNRAMFNLTNFAAQAGLGRPIAANYFVVSNMTGTPGAIGGSNATGTVGSGSSPTATGTMRSSPAAFTGAATAGKGVGLAMVLGGVAIGMMGM